MDSVYSAIASKATDANACWTVRMVASAYSVQTDTSVFALETLLDPYAPRAVKHSSAIIKTGSDLKVATPQIGYC